MPVMPVMAGVPRGPVLARATCGPRVDPSRQNVKACGRSGAGVQGTFAHARRKFAVSWNEPPVTVQDNLSNTGQPTGSGASACVPPRLLFIAAEFPYPPVHGGRADTWQRLKAMVAAGARVQLVCWTTERRGGTPSDDDMQAVRAVVDDLVVLPIGLTPADLAWRLANLLRMPSFVAARLPWGRQRRALLARVRAFGAGAVWVDGLWASGLGRLVARTLGWPYFYRSHNIEHKYMAAQARLADDGLLYQLRLQAALLGLQRWETDTVMGAARVFDISVDDLAHWQQRGLTRGEWLPPYVAPQVAAQAAATAGQPGALRHDAVFIGNLHTPNNVEAVAWLLQAVWPLVHARLPAAGLLLAGYAPNDRVRALVAAATGVTLLADPPDVWTLYASARVLVNPARTGSGVNIKSVEMLHFDRPVVSTSVGVGGLPTDIRAQFLVADDAQAFADALMAAMQQPVQSEADIARSRMRARSAFDAAGAAGLLRTIAVVAGGSAPGAFPAARATPSAPGARHMLLVHHDADLYGADQSFLRLARALLEARWHPIVLLPRQGPLVALLQQAGAEVHVGPVVKMARALLRSSAVWRLPAEVFAALRFIRRAVAGRRVLLVYSNSIAVLAGSLWARLHGTPHVWHVREIIRAPRLLARGFPALLRGLGGWCICNSGATRDWLTAAQPALAARSTVVWNGLEDQADDSALLASRGRTWRNGLGIGDDELVVTLVGRINRWKGQRVLVEAVGLLRAQGVQNLRCVLVGDVAEGEQALREALQAQVAAAGLRLHVLMPGFSADVAPAWAGSDVAVVPSEEPEPFGRVAIEAMAHGLPVVGTAHGGLVEIIEPGVTGLLVPPGDAPALAAALRQLLADPGMRKRFGAAGRARQRRLFTQSSHDAAVLTLLDGMLGGRRAPSGVNS